MASSSVDHSPTPEISNGFRVMHLVRGPITDQFRDLLCHHVPPNTLTGKLQQEKKKKKKTILNKLSAEQLLVLFPKSGVYQGNYSDLDIPLIYTLLRNLSGINPPSNGWGNEPDLNDRSVTANIERVRKLRNDISHKYMSLSDTKFQSCWITSKQIVRELDAHLSNNGKYEKILDDLKHKPLDPTETTFWHKNIKKRCREEKACNMEIKKLKRDHQNLKSELQKMKRKARTRIPENIREINASLFSDWKQEDHLYYEAAFFQSLMRKIEKKSMILVIGGPGCGKTATIRHLALKFLSSEFEVVPVEDVQDIISFGDIKRKQIFILDDVFGSIYFKSELHDKFKRVHYKIEKVLNDTSKLLMTCRKVVIMEAKRFDLHSSILENIFDLENGENLLTKWDRLSMLSNHLDEKTSSYDEIKDYVQKTETIPMFPLLCRMFSSNDAYKTEGCNFFRDPCRWILKYLQELEKESKLKYASLVMCMLNKGTISKEEVEDSSLLPILRRCCKVKSVENWEIIEALSDMGGTYVRETLQTFAFLYDIYYEAVICHFGRQYPNEIIDRLPSEMISKRICVNEYESSNSLQICICPEVFPKLANRLLRDLEDLQPYSVFESELLHNTDLCKCFLDLLEEQSYEDTKNLIIEPKTYHTSLIFKDGRGSVNFLPRLLIENAQGMKYIDDEYFEVTEYDDHAYILPLVNDVRYLSWVIAFGHLQILKYIVKTVVAHGETTSVIFGSDKRTQARLLVLACYSRKPDLVQLVLQHADPASVNLIPFQTSNAEEKVPTYCDFTPLKMAILQGSIGVVDALLEANADVNVLDENGLNPICIAIQASQERIFERLIEFNADVNHIKDGSPSPLILAALQDKSNILGVLLNKGADSNYRCASRETALYFASCQSNFESVKSLINFGADVNMYKDVDKSPFCVAAKNGHITILELLYEHGANCNFVSENGTPPLCLASSNGHLEVVHFLLEKGADVNQRRDSPYPPLLCAITQKHTNVATMLIKAGASRNCRGKDYRTALHEAVRTNEVKVLELLHARDLDYRAINDERITPLQMAVWMNRKEIVNILIKGENDIKKGSGNKHLFEVITDIRSSMLSLNHRDDIVAKDKGEYLAVARFNSVITDVLERDLYGSLEYVFGLGLRSNREIRKFEYFSFLDNLMDLMDTPESGTSILIFAIEEFADTMQLIIDHRFRTEPQVEYQRNPFIKCKNRFLSKSQLWESLDDIFWDNECYLNHCMDNTDSVLHNLQRQINMSELLMEFSCEDEIDYVCHENSIGLHKDTIKYLKTRMRRHSFP